MRIIHGQEVEIEPTPTFTVSKHTVSANVPHRSVRNVCESRTRLSTHPTVPPSRIATDGRAYSMLYCFIL